jgi:hypothetical protein
MICSTSKLRCAIVSNEDFLKLNILSNIPSLFLSNIILVIGGGFRTWFVPPLF